MEIQGTVRDILRSKGTKVWTTSPQSTVYEAIGIMGEQGIGALVVLEGGEVAGVFSERDYSRKVVLRGRTSRDTLVSEILSRPAITVTPGSGVELCMELMTKHHIRHLPVVEDGSLTGLVSMGDIVNWMLQTQRHMIHQLEVFIAGDYPA